MCAHSQDMLKQANGCLSICNVVVLLIIGLGAYLTHDILITNFLAYRICHSEQRPKTFINKTIESPESIYWEDNIYPGFDENDRLLMIRYYLDGVHLKEMALNAPDGKIYLYKANPEDWALSRAVHAKQKKGNYYAVLAEEAKVIASKGTVISPKELSQINYKVVFNPVKLTSFERRYLYSDEVTITEEKTEEVIAYNRRLMRGFYLLQPDFVGGRSYYPHAICGGGNTEGFDGMVLTEYNQFISVKHAGKR